MRKNLCIYLFAAVALLASSRLVGECRPERADGIVCGARCTVFGQFAGYCNIITPPLPEAGCIQYSGDECMSVDSSDCCGGPGLF